MELEGGLHQDSRILKLKGRRCSLNRRDDPMVFPGKADRETLTKLPPMILWSSEFDLYYTETVRFAARVREAGRLLE